MRPDWSVSNLQLRRCYGTTTERFDHERFPRACQRDGAAPAASGRRAATLPAACPPRMSVRRFRVRCARRKRPRNGAAASRLPRRALCMHAHGANDFWRARNETTGTTYGKKTRMQLFLLVKVSIYLGTLVASAFVSTGRWQPRRKRHRTSRPQRTFEGHLLAVQDGTIRATPQSTQLGLGPPES